MGRTGPNAPQHPPGPAAKLGVDQAGSMGPQNNSGTWTGGEMLPLYATRIEDLGQGGFVKVDRAACHHVAL